MNNGWLAFGFGIVLGGAIGTYAGYKVMSRKAQEVADRQVEDTKEALKRYYEGKIEKVKETAKEDNSDMGVDPGINDEETVKKSREVFPSNDTTVQPRDSVRAVRYDEVMKRPKDLPPTAINTPDGYPDPEDASAAPYLIREDDYGVLDDWDTLDLILWDCGTVTTDDSMCEPVEQALLIKLLPKDWVNMFGWSNKYVDSLYFRNNKEKRDIQIIKEHRTFRDWLAEVWPGRVSEYEDV